jgi:HD superfamily phosphohydrolase YqeK
MESAEGNIDRIGELKAKIDALYTSKSPERAHWADYLYGNHVFLVADKAAELAKRFGANPEIAQAAGMLHDVADAVIDRFNERHAAESDRIAKDFLRETGFNDAEIAVIVGDAMRYHSCREGEKPKTLEGKVMASADAVVHLASDFYDSAIVEFTRRGEPAEDIRKWGLEKIDRDLNAKIFFDEVREEMRPRYKELKRQFEAM